MKKKQKSLLGSHFVEACIGPTFLLEKQDQEEECILANMRKYIEKSSCLLSNQEKIVKNLLLRQANDSYSTLNNIKSPSEDKAGRKKRKKHKTYLKSTKNPLKLVHGDICVFLRPPFEASNKCINIVLVLVASHFKLYNDCPSECLIWFDTSNFSENNLNSVNVLSSSIVQGSPTFLSSDKEDQYEQIYEEFNNRGRYLSLIHI